MQIYTIYDLMFDDVPYLFVEFVEWMLMQLFFYLLSVVLCGKRLGILAVGL